ncbi:cytochrome C biogenesis protein [Bacillus rhizoplanae]|uniref:cytochrome C biogenesis protein n=1 Tax=Bacillus rhizoplanae TaxID=2880966 RepID=UPI003D220AE6
MGVKFVKVEVLLPEEYIETLRSKLNDIGVLTIGKYDHVISYSLVKGSWRPLEESKPFNGSIGEICFGTEYKMEFRCLYQNIEEVLSIIKSVHPYEGPVINVLPLLF